MFWVRVILKPSFVLLQLLMMHGFIVLQISPFTTSSLITYDLFHALNKIFYFVITCNQLVLLDYHAPAQICNKVQEKLRSFDVKNENVCMNISKENNFLKYQHKPLS